MGNIFLDQNFQVKLGDFGLALKENDVLWKEQLCGTPQYIAPEILNKEKYG